MNYIKLLNNFWKVRRAERITNLQADLFFFLLQECNSRDWENPFKISNGTIIAGITISEPSLIDARNRLKQLGLIDFVGGKKNVSSPVYTILSPGSQSSQASAAPDPGSGGGSGDYLNNLSRNRATSLVETEEPVKLLGKHESKQNRNENETREEIPLSHQVANAESFLLLNARLFESIVKATRRPMDLAKESLRKYHLHLEEKNLYPLSTKGVQAGFEKWLRNEKGAPAAGGVAATTVAPSFTNQDKRKADEERAKQIERGL